MSKPIRRTEVIIHPYDRVFTADFAQTPQWNRDLAASYHALYFTTFGTHYEESPFDLSDPFRQVQVFEGGVLIFSAPLARNEVGEWSHFGAAGMDLPINDIKYVEWYARDVPGLLRAIEVAASHGIIFDLPQMRSAVWSEGMLRRYVERSPYLHEGMTSYLIPATTPEAYIEACGHKKMRGALRKAWRNRWTYTPSSQLGDYIALVTEWWERWDNSEYTLDYYIGLYRLLGSEHCRLFYIHDEQGDLVGADVWVWDGEHWFAKRTPWREQYRKQQPGAWAMLAAMKWMQAQEPNSMLNIGGVAYDEDAEFGEGKASAEMSYKMRWATDLLRTFTFGLGDWEDRETPPTLALDSYLHYALCLYRLCIITQPDEDTDGLLETIEGLEHALPDGWDDPQYMRTAWGMIPDSALENEHPLSISNRLFRLHTNGLGLDPFAVEEYLGAL